MKRVAIIGSVGVPAAYGGFETMVENIIGDNASDSLSYTVFCSSKDLPSGASSYKGAELRYVPLRANGVQSIPYDIWSMLKVVRGYDVVLVLGVSGCSFLPVFKLLSRSKLIVNIDGMEWRRAKWNSFAKWFLKFSESVAVGYADVVIADNQGIVDYVAGEYDRGAELIAYGGDHVVCDVAEEERDAVLSKYGVEVGDYAISICRIEPENNCATILEAVALSGMKMMIFIGNWERSEYGRELKTKYAEFENIKIVDAIYDLRETYILRHNSSLYLHGHSAGGTNPSLVEAMHCGCNVVAFDVVYNRETTENQSVYFSDVDSLVEAIESKSAIETSVKMLEIAQRRYCWRQIAQQYESLY
ncbi:MAG: DUF1972 domain-containing protein [Rikenellaceae bacterium]